MAGKTGVHHQFPYNQFTNEEILIINNISREWFVTHGGSARIASSEYRYILIRPRTLYKEMFNLERELIVVFSPYQSFETRTLDAFCVAKARIQDLRTENICRVLVSKDHNIESQIDKRIKGDPEQPMVVPFTYAELSGKYDDFFFRNRFRKYFYSRDLFSFFSPLKRELYFFGRSELIQELVSRHMSGEHTGLFGLRKSGKTSIIYAIERALSTAEEQFLSIDSESPSVHKLRWNELLHRIACEYHSVKESKDPVPDRAQYTETEAADSFHKDMLHIYKSKKLRPVLMIFDEIERISPRTGSSAHWRDGEDFVYFWQTMRGFYQRNPEVLTYMLVSTNPICVELSTISGHENPLFGSIPLTYVPSFSVDQVREMVRKLGRYMGLKFEEIIYAKLTEDFGGHPFLIRHACSAINKACSGDRPTTVNKALYNRAKSNFLINAGEYFEMIVQVLRDRYPDEYEMLKYLSVDNLSDFHLFAAEHPRYTKHLIGYGIIDKSEHGYAVNIESLKEFVASEQRYFRLDLTDEEKVSEVSERRNRIEKGLRSILKSCLRIKVGRKKAAHAALAALPEARRKNLASTDIDELLHRDKSPLFFPDLINIINREWGSVQHVFEMEKIRVLLILEDINKIGRPDAHAKRIDTKQFSQLRLHFETLEKILGDWTNVAS